MLLIPVGPITRDVFDAYTAEIKAFDSMRLGDVPGDAKGDKGPFLLYSYSVSSVPMFLQLVSCPIPSQLAIFI